jgi:hypothetical protein
MQLPPELPPVAAIANGLDGVSPPPREPTPRRVCGIPPSDIARENPWGLPKEQGTWERTQAERTRTCSRSWT